MIYSSPSATRTGIFLTSTPLNGGETTAKLACAGSTRCGQLKYPTTNIGFLRSVSSIMYSSASRTVSLLYHRPLIGLATGSPLASTRFDSAPFPARQPALLTCTISDGDTKASTAKCARQQSGASFSMYMTRLLTLLTLKCTTTSNTVIFSQI